MPKSATKSAQKSKVRAKPITATKRAHIKLPPTRIMKLMKRDRLNKTIRRDSSVYMAAVLDYLVQLHAPQVHLGVFRAPLPRPPTPPSPRPPPPAERHLRGQKRALDPLLTLSAAPQSPTLIATKYPRPIVAICGVCSRLRAQYRCLAHQRTDQPRDMPV